MQASCGLAKGLKKDNVLNQNIMKKILLFVLAGLAALTLSAKDKKATAAADAFH